MTDIGIVGAGIAGLHLGLFLRQQNIPATIYTEKTPAQQRDGRLTNIVLRSAPTREREQMLGVNHWDASKLDLVRLRMHIGGPHPLSFSADLDRPAQVVDMRMYWARLLEDFAARGGTVVTGAVQPDDLEQLAARHDLIVVAAGRGNLANLFPRQPEHSPYDKPQRLVVGGLFRGIAYPQPLGYDITIVPGQGEILVFPVHSFKPNLTAVAFEMIPGGLFEPLRHLRYDDDPDLFHATLLGLFREHAPSVYNRVDTRAFAIARPLDLCHAAITPVVRRSYVELKGGVFAVALGDTHMLVDPLAGQGANTASHSAWVLGQAISGSEVFDEAFCQRAEQCVRAYALPVTQYCNGRLRPPQPHMVEMLTAATQHQAIADAFAQGFNHPDWLYEIVSSPARTAAFMAEQGWRAMPTATSTRERVVHSYEPHH